MLEVLAAISAVTGADKTGIRICPGNPFNGLQDTNPAETFAALLQRIDSMNLAYVHVIRMPTTGIDTIQLVKDNYSGAIIVNDSYTAEEAANTIAEGVAAVSFGRLYIANPDLVERFRQKAEFNRLDASTLYTPGAKGYTDYPTMNRTR